MSDKMSSACSETRFTVDGAVIETDREVVYSQRLARHIPKALYHSRRTLAALVDSGAPVEIINYMSSVLSCLEVVRQKAELYVEKVQGNVNEEASARAREKKIADLEKEVAALKSDLQAKVGTVSSPAGNVDPPTQEPQPPTSFIITSPPGLVLKGE